MGKGSYLGGCTIYTIKDLFWQHYGWRGDISGFYSDIGRKKKKKKKKKRPQQSINKNSQILEGSNINASKRKKNTKPKSCRLNLVAKNFEKRGFILNALQCYKEANMLKDVQRLQRMLTMKKRKKKKRKLGI